MTFRSKEQRWQRGRSDRPMTLSYLPEQDTFASKGALQILRSLGSHPEGSLQAASFADLDAQEWMLVLTCLRNRDLGIIEDTEPNSLTYLPRTMEQIEIDQMLLLLHAMLPFPNAVHFLVANLSTFTSLRRLDVIVFLIAHAPDALRSLVVMDHAEIVEDVTFSGKNSVSDRATRAWIYLEWLVASETIPSLVLGDHLCYLASWLWLVAGDRDRVRRFTRYTSYPKHRAIYASRAISALAEHPRVDMMTDDIPTVWLIYYFQRTTDLPQDCSPEIFQMLGNLILGRDYPVPISDLEYDLSLQELFWLARDPVPMIRFWLLREMEREWIVGCTSDTIAFTQIKYAMLSELIDRFWDLLDLKDVGPEQCELGLVAILDLVKDDAEISYELSYKLAGLVGWLGDYRILSVWAKIGALDLKRLLGSLLREEAKEIFKAVWDQIEIDLIIKSANSDQWSLAERNLVEEILESELALGMAGFLLLHEKMTIADAPWFGSVFQEMMDQLLVRNLEQMSDDHNDAVIAWCGCLPVHYHPGSLLPPDLPAEQASVRTKLFLLSLVSEPVHKGYLHRYFWPMISSMQMEDLVSATVLIILRGQNRAYVTDRYPVIADHMLLESERTLMTYAYRSVEHATEENWEATLAEITTLLDGISVPEDTYREIIQSAINQGLWLLVRALWDLSPNLVSKDHLIAMVLTSNRLPSAEILAHPIFSQGNLVHAAACFFAREDAYLEIIPCYKFAMLIRGLDFHITHQGHFYLVTPAREGFDFWSTRRYGDHTVHFVDHGEDITSHYLLQATLSGERL